MDWVLYGVRMKRRSSTPQQQNHILTLPNSWPPSRAPGLNAPGTDGKGRNLLLSVEACALLSASTSVALRQGLLFYLKVATAFASSSNDSNTVKSLVMDKRS